MTRISHGAHLARRFVMSLSRREPAPPDTAWAESYLCDGELELWRRMSPADRRHAIAVARRFVDIGASGDGMTATWSRDEMAGALLHDVGKLDSGLGTTTRVVATIVGPRTAGFRRYHDHERIGAEMLSAAGSPEVTTELVHGRGRAAKALAEADDL